MSSINIDLGAKIDVPSDVVREQSDLIQTALSPFTQGMGYLGDKVSFFRFKSGLKTLHRARELADEHGVKLKAPPLKFLLPLIEDASCEQEDDPLCEAWARLLFSAATVDDFQPKFQLYKDVLKSITAREAAVLNEMWESRQRVFQHFDERNFGWIEKLVECNSEISSTKIEAGKRARVADLDNLRGAVQRGIRQTMRVNWNTETGDNSAMLAIKRTLGVQCFKFSTSIVEFDDPKGVLGQTEDSNMWDYAQSHVLLKHYGLLQDAVVDVRVELRGMNVIARANYFEFTNAGFDFVETCTQSHV
jgi:hypothetical protein